MIQHFRVFLPLVCLVCICVGCAQIKTLLPSVNDSSEVTIRQEVLLSPKVFGAAAQISKRELLKQEKTIQETKIEPLLDKLHKKGEDEIFALLGNPGRKLREGETQVWQYFTELCQWDVYFLRNNLMQQAIVADIIIHYQGNILTKTDDIARCEQAIREKRNLIL